MPAAAVPGEATEHAPLPVRIVETLRALPSASWWPGFDAARVPVAIFDGEHTYLFGHPSPPAEFVEIDGGFRVAGQHPSLVANTSFDLGGVSTAGVILSTVESEDLRALAALVAHEAFHVYQRREHPDWIANEGDLFVYPFGDRDNLKSRVLETYALRQALSAEGASRRAWAARAVQIRAERFASLGDAFVRYEGRSELNEGLAAYIQWQAEGSADDPSLPQPDFAAQEVRQRTYATGTAFARLLDDIDPGWKKRIDDTDTLDRLLRAALTDVPPITIDDDVKRRATEHAAAESAAFLEHIARVRRELDEAAGTRVTIVAGSEPMAPAGFDPLNVTAVAAKEVVHHRYLELSSSAGQLQLDGVASLTVGAGEHPLFQGISRITFTVPALDVQETADGVTLTAEGVGATLAGATVRRDERAVVVTLP